MQLTFVEKVITVLLFPALLAFFAGPPILWVFRQVRIIDARPQAIGMVQA
jgi:hypothetical protein